ncbi:hypothetical protein [Streptomyces sp. NPDC006446]|uniref:hypothetical protein n=1 Tax=Streptomyces sp. NPDC006446 TaxID=3154301 RepID=UPI0033A55AC5
MGEAQGIDEIMKKLRARSVLSMDEVYELQARIDLLENSAITEATHHDTHSTPGSHYSQHHSSVEELKGFLDRPSDGKAAGEAEQA